MRQHLAKLSSMFLVGGCSLLYNPDRIGPGTDAKVYEDAPPVDVDPNSLMITSVDSPPLVEGQGDEGSRPAVLVLRGANITQDATVSIESASEPVNIELVGEPVISNQGDMIAIAVIARVDKDLPAGTTRDLVVKVSQPLLLGGVAEQHAMWQLKGLDELEGATGTIDTAAPREYSRVDVQTLTYSGTGRVIVRATASIKVANAINVSANGTVPGPGGGMGGGPEGDGKGPGYGKKGVAGSKGGGGGGFVIAGEDGGSNIGSGGAMTGDRLITSYATNASSGGGGANSTGGAGGGTLELTAGGNLTVSGAISSKGSNGAGGLLAAGAGGGSGGVVVLRSGATATVAGIDLDGGAGGKGTLQLGAGDGGAGRQGRARIDAVEIVGDMGPAHRGIMFDAITPVITRDSMLNVRVLGSSGDRFDIQRASTSFAPIGEKTTIDFGGAAELEPTVMLDPGFNRVCFIPESSGLGNPESRNCFDVAFVP